MSKHEIEVEGLPEGWDTVTYRRPKINEHVFIGGNIIKSEQVNMCYEQLIVKKKQPRRITFEETDCADISDIDFSGGVQWRFWGGKYWREVKETEETKLCLSVEECENILSIAVLPTSVEKKMKLFLRNNNKTY